MTTAVVTPLSARTDWTLIALLYAVGLLAAGQFAKISLTLGALAQVYPGREAALPWVVSGLSLMGVVFGATAGMIVARVGVRVVLLGGLCLGATLSLAQALVPPFPAFLVLRLAEGAAHLSLVVAAPTLMAAVSAPQSRSLVMGLWGTFFGVGFALAALVVPALLATWGVAAVYWAHGLVLLAVGAVLAPRLPPMGLHVPDAGGFVARHLAIYRTPETFAPALGFFWHALMFLALLTYLPRFLGDWTAPVLPLVALVGTFGAGALARTMPAERVLIWGFALTIALMLVLLAVPEAARIWVALLLFVVIGLAPGASFALIPALNADGRAQARANGALAQMGNLGTASSTPLFALTLGAGLAGPVLLAAALAAAALVAVWLIHRKIAGHR